MTRPRTYVDYLHDILDAAKNGQAFVQGMTFEAFVNDTKTVYAVIRVLEIIGEATKSIPPHVRERDPSIPWRLMARMRDKLTHAYFGVNLAVVWKTVTEDLPMLEPAVAQVLRQQIEYEQQQENQ